VINFNQFSELELCSLRHQILQALFSQFLPLDLLFLLPFLLFLGLSDPPLFLLLLPHDPFNLSLRSLSSHSLLMLECMLSLLF
jgi:hypothetical protein